MAYLWTRLVVPLAAVSAAFLLAAYRWQGLDGLFVNVATEVVGIIVTVAYVDWVLRRREVRLWRGTDARVASRLQTFAIALVSGIRAALGISPNVLNFDAVTGDDQVRLRSELVRVADDVITPSLTRLLNELDQAGWQRLARHLQFVWNGADRLQDLYSPRLDPTRIEHLLDIQEEAEGALSFVQTFPDVAGVPDDQLPQSRTPPVILKQQGYEMTELHLRELLSHAKELLQDV